MFYISITYFIHVVCIAWQSNARDISNFQQFDVSKRMICAVVVMSINVLLMFRDRNEWKKNVLIKFFIPTTFQCTSKLAERRLFCRPFIFPAAFVLSIDAPVGNSRNSLSSTRAKLCDMKVYCWHRRNCIDLMTVEVGRICIYCKKEKCFPRQL